MAEVTAADVARRIGVAPATLRRWVRSGLVPLADGTWTDAAIAVAVADAARAAGGELLVTRQVTHAAGDHLRFEQIGELALKGFNEPTELFVAGVRE